MSNGHNHWTYSTPMDILPHWTYPRRDLVPEILTPGKDMGPEIAPLLVDRMTDTCENITFPQLRLRVVINHKLQSIITTHLHKQDFTCVISRERIACINTRWKLPCWSVNRLTRYSFFKKNNPSCGKRNGSCGFWCSGSCFGFPPDLLVLSKMEN